MAARRKKTVAKKHAKKAKKGLVGHIARHRKVKAAKKGDMKKARKRVKKA